jgi:uncharacterized protein YpmB
MSRMKILLIILISILVLNVLDAIFTTYWVGVKNVEEANPLMQELVRYPIIFVTTKISLVSLCLYLLWLQSKKKFVVVMSGSILIFVVLIGVFCYHVWGFLNI